MIWNSQKSGALSAVLALAVLIGCSEEESLGELEQPANTGPVGFADVVDLDDVQLAGAIKPAFGFGPIQNSAKDLCGEKQKCSILIFEEGTTLPTALPFTDREEDSAIALYELDRDEGIDEMEVRCPTIPRTPAENCMEE